MLTNPPQRTQRTAKGSPKCDLSHLTLSGRKPKGIYAVRCLGMRWNPGLQQPECAKQGYVCIVGGESGGKNGAQAAGLAASGRQSWQPQIIIDISKISLHCSVVQGNWQRWQGDGRSLPFSFSPVSTIRWPPTTPAIIEWTVRKNRK